MKTTKIFSVLSLILILSISFAYASKGPDKSKDMASRNKIRYEVIIHNLNAVNLSNTYQVQITDETGRLIARPVTLVPGISKYTFFEEAPATGRLRKATLALSTHVDNLVTHVGFTLRPAYLLWPFLGGRTYTFHLYPVVQEGIHENNEQ